MSADRETGRLEAAELAMQFDAPIEASFWDLARTGLSAADQWDQENGYVRVRLDEARGVIARALYAHQWAGMGLPTDEADCCAEVAVAALREAAEQ